ncbi:Spo0E family sporulation regulatory protein-aspartic acid phosphatase [Carboxydothermus islandicus]|uniref:Spo0E family sporulation regulatory protein-aspartic acid phosphatase n=1 Tax=Carboxydothermus islandicus TaxID=661089 RepID=A0A1L8D192_9THEO|nr:Spo0E family sporulation regulatory protein-aspartic acid phosphatase [Carboxydothermus islandicus]
MVALQNKKIEILLKTIELLKAELAQLVDEAAEFTDPEVVKKSQELDRVLIEYYQFLKSVNKENTLKDKPG